MKYKREIPNITSNYLYELLTHRGISDVDSYLNPSQELEEDMSLLVNIEKGYNLYKKTLELDHPIIKIVVDSDQDGYTSAAIIYLYTKELCPEAEISYCIHNGKQHGLEDMSLLLNEKIDLLIVPDASSNDYALHKQFAEAKIPILILDHHEAEKLSEDAIVINNQFGSYPNRYLSGAGVVYKFCKYCDKKLGRNLASEFLDLAAVGIIGDVMKVTPLENRYIISQGLKQIKNPFLAALVEKQAFSIKDTTRLTPTHIAFYITPLINALIRVGKEEEKMQMFEAFINGDKIVASTKRGAKGEDETIAEQVARNCVNARSRQNRLKDKAIEQLQMQVSKTGLDENKVIICQIQEGEEIDTTLTGLIAMNLCSFYSKPVIVGRFDSEGNLKGSARGDNKNEIGNKLKDFFTESGYFEYAEGHQAAHGICIKKENIETFTTYANNKLANFDFSEGTYIVDFIRESNDLSIADLILELAYAAGLWGQDNSEPLILVKDIIMPASELTLLKCKVDNIQFDHNEVEYIMFGVEKLVNELALMGVEFNEKYKQSARSESWRSTSEKEIKLTLVGVAAINAWMGRESPQFTIKDYILENPLFDF